MWAKLQADDGLVCMPPGTKANSMSVQVNVKLNKLDDLARGLQGDVDEGLEEMGEQIYDIAYPNTARATGALAESLFVEVRDGELQAGYTVDYAPDVELGNAKQAAQPALVPAFDAVATPNAVADMISKKIEDLAS